MTNRRSAHRLLPGPCPEDPGGDDGTRTHDLLRANKMVLAFCFIARIREFGENPLVRTRKHPLRPLPLVTAGDRSL